MPRESTVQVFFPSALFSHTTKEEEERKGFAFLGVSFRTFCRFNPKYIYDIVDVKKANENSGLRFVCGLSELELGALWKSFFFIEVCLRWSALVFADEMRSSVVLSRLCGFSTLAARNRRSTSGKGLWSLNGWGLFGGVCATGSALVYLASGRNDAASDAAEELESVDASFGGEDGSRYYIPPAEESRMKIFSGNANWHLANEISMHLGTQLGRAAVRRFPDGEVSVHVLDNVRGKDVFLVQPLAPPVNENLMELLLLTTTLRRSSARRITAVIPYYGYCRSTHKNKNERTPIAAADVAKMLQVAGVDRVIAVDLHHAQIQGFFGPSTPVDNLDVSSLAIPYFKTKFLRSPVIVSPDPNGAARAKVFRDKLIKSKIDASLAVIVDHNSKKRGWEEDQGDVDAAVNLNTINDWTFQQLEGIELVGDVTGKDVIIFDDMIESGARITRAAKKLKLAGARRVFAFATHGLFLGKAYERIEKSDLIEVVCVNTVPLRTINVGGVNSWVYSNKVHQLSVAALLAEAIRRIHKKQSVTELA